MTEHILIGIGIITLAATGCGPAGDSDEEAVGEAASAELDPGVRDYDIYSLKDQKGATVAKILRTRTANGVFAADMEYRNVLSLTGLKSATSLSLTGGGDKQWGGGLTFAYSFKVPGGSWSGQASPPVRTQSNNLYMGYDAIQNAVAIDMSQLAFADGVWGGSIQWWAGSPSNVTVGSLGAGSVSFSTAMAVPSLPAWYTIVSTVAP
jgi:hypothetical protein